MTNLYDEILGKTVNIPTFDINTFEATTKPLTVFGFMDGPENDQQDYVILVDSDGEESTMPFANLIKAMEVAEKYCLA